MPTQVQIGISVQSNLRNNDELWKGTTIVHEAFHLDTNLDEYIVDVIPYAVTVFNYVQAERARGAYMSVQVNVTLENVTHPTPAKGVVILPKGYREFQLTDEQFVSSDILRNMLVEVVADLKHTAKY